MKLLFGLVFVVGAFSSLALFADATVCTPWSMVNNQSCIFGDGENGSSWVRTCSYGSTTCTPHRPFPGNVPCQADTVCMGTQSGDVGDPNDIQGVCTPWRLAEFQNVACPDGHQSRWVRACTLERLLTKTCAVESPPNNF